MSETLTRVGPGTRMGNLLRRYWVPALASSEIPEADGPQVRVQLLGEKLLAFRNTDGKACLIGEFCSHRGVSLYFTTELVIERPRWYWLNATVVERSLDYRLSYHAITRSFRLSIGSIHQSFDNLESAVRTMQRVRNWQVADLETLQAGVSHEVSLRFRLDTSQLPKPFQVTAIGSSDWNIGTDWVHWTFLPGAPGFR